MVYRVNFIIMGVLLLTLFGCGKKESESEMKESEFEKPTISQRLSAYANTHIIADLSHLTDNQLKVVQLLTEAGHLADQIFWQQTSHNSIAVRDSLKTSATAEAKELLQYVMINYGPYDVIYDNENFVGNGPEKRYAGGNFYPIGITKEEFENYIKKNPAQKDELTNQYTVVRRDGGKLISIPYHKYYPEVEVLAKKLEEAAQYADNHTLKNYLLLRAKAIRTDDYYESDMAWMDIKNSDIDIVIGPIENYEDGLFNYKTAYEAVVMIKDIEATEELEMFESNIDYFEHNLPYDKKYIRETAGKGNILQIMNVVYFGGDCQKGIKTIAASLPNDPRVTEVKGGKKSMYKNIMEAKFDKILMPVAGKILDQSLIPFVNRKAFTSFVTLHEVSHTLGRGFVYGNDSLTVRTALKEKYSAIEECKADILGMFNHKHLLDLKKIDKDYLKKAMVTYLAGLYRSIRFGAEEAHGKANLIQLRFLREKGAIKKLPDGKLTIDETHFFEHVAELAKIVLTIEAEGDYNAASELLDKYGTLTAELKSEIELIKNIPRDLNTTYEF